MRTILLLHQSAELYGSDKMLLALASGLERSRFRAIVLLPEEGPLAEALCAAGIEVRVVPLLLAERSCWSLAGLLSLPQRLRTSLAAIDAAVAGEQIDWVHSNTLALLSGAFWARRRRLPHLWHVHEIVEHPKLAKVAFGWLLRRYADRVVCVSQAVADFWLTVCPALRGRMRVVHNGIETEPAAVALPHADAREAPLTIGLVGRINRWKGQLLLLRAFEQLADPGLRLLFVGSAPPGQEHFLQQLEAAIAASPCAAQIRIHPFTRDIDAVWQEIDIAVVPSTEPEPFGLVALEAMRAGKPVVAAAHGGLREIVVDGESGLWVAPGDVGALVAALARLAGDGGLCASMGAAGRARCRAQFSLSAHLRAFETLYAEMTQ